MTPEFLLVSMLFAACLVAAAGWDIATYTIPNFLQIALLAGFAAFALFSHMPAAALGLHALAAAIGLVMGFTLFALGYVGGGDAKLFVVVALWFGLSDFASYALLASIFGGILTLGLLGFRTLPLPPFLASQGWLSRLHDRKSGIPYGVALAAGAFVILPNTEIFRIGLGG